ncbi:MAG: PhnA protein, partial [Gammaproteobacteria bacterium]
MNTETILRSRSDSRCELCGATDELGVYEVPPVSDASAEQCVLVCETCR